MIQIPLPCSSSVATCLQFILFQLLSPMHRLLNKQSAFIIFKICSKLLAYFVNPPKPDIDAALGLAISVFMLVSRISLSVRNIVKNRIHHV